MFWLPKRSRLTTPAGRTPARRSSTFRPRLEALEDRRLLSVSLADPGFETPDVGAGSDYSFQYDPSGSPWTFSGSAGISGNGSWFTRGNPNAPEAKQVALLRTTGNISQNVNFAAGTYVVTFQAAHRANETQPLGLPLGDGLQVLIDGRTVGKFYLTSTAYTAQMTSAFAVKAGTHTLSFVGYNPFPGDHTAFIDQVSVDLLPSPADPGFETPNVGTDSWGSFQYDPAGSPWSFSGTAGVSGNGSGFTAANPNAPQGNQVAFLQGSGSMSQAVSFPAGTYTVSFQAAQRGPANSQKIRVLVDGIAVGGAMPQGTTYAGYVTGSFTVARGTHVISFVGLNPYGDNTAFIDQVRITPADFPQGLLTDSGLAGVAGSLLNRDHYLSRNDMIQIFREAEAEDGPGGTLTAAQVTDFQTLADNASLLGMPDSVRVLSNKIANGDPANAHYQGAALGNLSTSTSGSQLEELVGKWFLGTDHPQAAAGLTYRQASGSLFGPGGPSAPDVVQGALGDCWALAALAETASREPSAIRDLFTGNGDGTYTLRFFQNGVADYVTVDGYLPVTSGGTFYYANIGRAANDSNNVLWVALAEKAYAQLSESGWNGRPASNAYGSLDWGNPLPVLTQITGRLPYWDHPSDASKMSTVVSEFQAGDLLTLISAGTTSPGFVASHAYALTGYDPGTQTFTLYNPWGSYVTGVTWSQIQANFVEWECAYL